MADFNVTHSKIEQLNTSGDNYKISNTSAPVTVAGDHAAQAVGEDNKATLNEPKKSSNLNRVVGWLVSCWQWITGNRG